MDFEEDTEETRTDVSTLDLLYGIQQLREDFIELRRRYSAQNTVLTGTIVRIRKMEQDINLLKTEAQSQGLRLTKLSNWVEKLLSKNSGDGNDR